MKGWWCCVEYTVLPAFWLASGSKEWYYDKSRHSEKKRQNSLVISRKEAIKW